MKLKNYQFLLFNILISIPFQSMAQVTITRNFWVIVSFNVPVIRLLAVPLLVLFKILSFSCFYYKTNIKNFFLTIIQYFYFKNWKFKLSKNKIFGISSWKIHKSNGKFLCQPFQSSSNHIFFWSILPIPILVTHLSLFGFPLHSGSLGTLSHHLHYTNLESLSFGSNGTFFWLSAPLPSKFRYNLISNQGQPHSHTPDLPSKWVDWLNWNSKFWGLRGVARKLKSRTHKNAKLEPY